MKLKVAQCPPPSHPHLRPLPHDARLGQQRVIYMVGLNFYLELIALPPLLQPSVLPPLHYQMQPLLFQELLFFVKLNCNRRSKWYFKPTFYASSPGLCHCLHGLPQSRETNLHSTPYITERVHTPT